VERAELPFSLFFRCLILVLAFHTIGGASLLVLFGPAFVRLVLDCLAFILALAASGAVIALLAPVHALDDFGQNLRDQVIAVLEKVGVSPNDATPCGREKLVEYSNRTRFLRSHSHPYRVHHLSYPNSCRLKAQLDQVSL
jgi:hypothetical protein